MEELKTCPYSRPQISSAVDRMMQAAIKQDPTYLWPIDCYVALWALKNIGRAAPENKPLTLEQLKCMNRRPIWATGRRSLGTEVNGWMLISTKSSRPAALDFTGACNFADYGKTWLAYAHKSGGSAP